MKREAIDKCGEHGERLAVSSSKLDGRSEGKTIRYNVVIEKARSNYAAYVSDLPGCVATGATVEETEKLIRKAIDFHLEG